MGGQTFSTSLRASCNTMKEKTAPLRPKEDSRDRLDRLRQTSCKLYPPPAAWCTQHLPGKIEVRRPSTHNWETDTFRRLDLTPSEHRESLRRAQVRGKKKVFPCVQKTRGLPPGTSGHSQDQGSPSSASWLRGSLQAERRTSTSRVKEKNASRLMFRSKREVKLCVRSIFPCVVELFGGHADAYDLHTSVIALLCSQTFPSRAACPKRCALHLRRAHR